MISFSSTLIASLSVASIIKLSGAASLTSDLVIPSKGSCIVELFAHPLLDYLELFSSVLICLCSSQSITLLLVIVVLFTRWSISLLLLVRLFSML